MGLRRSAAEARSSRSKRFATDGSSPFTLPCAKVRRSLESRSSLKGRRRLVGLVEVPRYLDFPQWIRRGDKKGTLP